MDMKELDKYLDSQRVEGSKNNYKTIKAATLASLYYSPMFAWCDKVGYLRGYRAISFVETKKG